MKKLALIVIAGAMFAACNQATEKTETVDSAAVVTEAAAVVDTAAKMVVDSAAAVAAPATEEKH
jgi:uncharacterized protein YcfL